MTAVNFYKITCLETKRVYVGSTTQTITLRLQKHESDYRRYLNGRSHFTTSFTIIEKNNYSIQLIDTVVCTDKKHRNTLERLHILNNDCVNRNQPGRECKQWQSDNKEKLREYIKQYNQENKEKIQRYQQEYREENKENTQQYQKQYQQQYYTENKAKIQQYQKQKFICSCNGKYTQVNKLRHMKSKKHIAYIATL
jgi:uncharacterized membrane protein